MDSSFSHEEGVFALVVREQSMIDDHICDGDYVVIKPDASYHDGDIIVATHLLGSEHGSATLKLIFVEADYIRLQPANAWVEPIRVPKSAWKQEWEVQGRVVAILLTSKIVEHSPYLPLNDNNFSTSFSEITCIQVSVIEVTCM